MSFYQRIAYDRGFDGPALTPAEGDATVCAIYAELDDTTGFTRKIGPVRIGGRLSPAWPN